MSVKAGIVFVCPSCGASHRRGFLNGIDCFRCLRCGYTGHGFHPDHDTDRALFEEHQANNALNRSLGLPEIPLGVDPLNGPG